MNTVFQITENPYAFRNEIRVKARNVHIVRYGVETASYSEPKMWNSMGYKAFDTLNIEYKAFDALNKCNARSKNWCPGKWQCKLCKTYIFRTCRKYYFRDFIFVKLTFVVHQFVITAPICNNKCCPDL